MVSKAILAVGSVIPVLYILRKLIERSWGSCSNKVSLEKKVVLITGANCGLGKETARELARRGGTIIMACRNMSAAQDAIADIRKETNCGKLIPMHVDMASLASVKKFAAQVLKEFSEIHILINNAGVHLEPGVSEKSEDGYELHFAVNHLGHFLLTELLLPALKNSAPSRIVNVASDLHKKGKIDLDTDFGFPKENPPKTKSLVNPLYCDSKLCNFYHILDLTKRTSGAGVDCFAVCPGWCYTGLLRHAKVRWYQIMLMLPIAFLFMRSARIGAQSIILCATEESLKGQSGKYFRNCREYESTVSFDPKITENLRLKSQSLIQQAGISLRRP